ncbi:hypothetical protein [Pseudomonas putida]|uniref:Uncharacterized protein n=1 Tax=Pseudomonas putida TaxID=303 RepID=A0A1Q9QVC4_PSEPU|nr:hypothetical protein [Pseudomonas putida]OLS59088.1 hypothetical protein PSEMO_60490 [Pseudomonas putida]
MEENLFNRLVESMIEMDRIHREELVYSRKLAVDPALVGAGLSDRRTAAMEREAVPKSSSENLP